MKLASCFTTSIRAHRQPLAVAALRPRRAPLCTGTASFDAVRHTEVRLRSRPAPNAAVTLDNFDVSTTASTGTESLKQGEIRCQTLYLSVDPFLRCRFNEDTGVDYTAPYEVGGLISSAGVGVVVESEAPGVQTGSLVVDPFDSWPWSSSVTMQGDKATVVPQELALMVPVTSLLGCVGQTGITAYCGVVNHGNIAAGDVLVVSGAAGAVGHVVGQLAKRRGARRVVGIAGSAEKGAVLRDKCGCDATVNYKSPAFATDLTEALAGLEVSHYFDNVGGTVTDAVIEHMAEDSLIILCGQIASYDLDVPYPPPLSPRSQEIADARRISRPRYLVLNYKDEIGAAFAELATLVAGEHIAALETCTGDLANAPAAFVDMMHGGNVGKALVQCAEPPSRLRTYNAIRTNVLPAGLRQFMARKLISPDMFTL